MSADLSSVGEAFVKIMPEMSGFASSLTSGIMPGLASAETLGAAALVGLGAESVKLGAQFQSTMELLHTEAHVPQSAIAGLSDQVLNLSGKVATNPDSLAEALYHIESSFQSMGIKGAGAMKILQTSAEGAKIGQANIVDVTNALDAAIASGIPGVQNYSQAMGSLLSIVGSGDMSMQDLADALGTGVLAVVKQYGLSLNDAGAALATFGDNNIRGQVAATDLRMAVMDLSKQSTAGTTELAKLGIKAGQLGDDLRTGGLNKAMTDLRDHLVSSGISADRWGVILEDAFTKKSSAPLAILLGQMDRFQSKYPDLEKGANSFGDSWKRTTQTFSFQMHQLSTDLDAIGIRVGLFLIPLLERAGVGLEQVWKAVGPTLEQVWANFKQVFSDAEKLGDAFGAGLSGKGVAPGSNPLIRLMDELGKIIRPLAQFITGTLLPALGGLGNVAKYVAIAWGISISPILGMAAAYDYAYHHSAAFRDVINTVANVLMDDVIPAVREAATWVQDHLNVAIRDATPYWHEFAQVVTEVWDQTVGRIRIGVGIVVELFHLFHGTITGIWSATWHNLLAVVEFVFGTLWDILKTGLAVMWDMVKFALDLLTGHWSKAWGDLLDIPRRILGLVARELGRVGELFVTVLSGLGTVLSGVFSDVGRDLLQPIWDAVSGAASGVWDALSGGADQAGSGIASFFTSLPGKIVGWLSSAAGTVFTAGLHFFENLPHALLQMAVDLPALMIAAVLTSAAALIRGGPMLASAAVATFHWMVQAAVTAVDAVVGEVEAAPGQVVNGLRVLGSAISSAATAAWAGLSSAATVAATAVWHEMEALPSQVANGLTALAGVISHAAVAAFNWLANAATAAATATVNEVETLPGQVGRAAASLAGSIATWAANAFHQLVKAADDAGTAVYHWIVGLPGKMLQWAQSLLTTMYNIGRDIVAGIARGISDSASDIVDTIKNKVTDILPGFVKSTLGIHSPSTVFAEIGANLMQGMAGGISDNAHLPSQALAKVTSAIAGTRLSAVQLGLTAAGSALGSAGGAGTAGGAAAGQVVYAPTNHFVLPDGAAPWSDEQLAQLDKLLDQHANDAMTELTELHLSQIGGSR